MKILRSLEEYREFRRQLRGSIGFVPTMGQLHAGHVALLQQARRDSEVVVLSIFVNPTQFNDPNDLANYPRDFENDQRLALEAGVDAIWCPEVSTLYPDDYRYQIQEKELSTVLEGVSRPGHFTGMLTVVMKLLQCAQATRAYFGEKDYQQLKLVQGMAEAFFLKTEIIPAPIVRDEHGLALSSRHKRMSSEELEIAREFSRIFLSATDPKTCQAALTARGITVEYNEILHDRWLIAVNIGATRLIDNKSFRHTIEKPVLY